MSSPSNIYAEKIFAEHPVALWALDDQADFISLISEEDRNLLNWDIYIDGDKLSNNEKQDLVAIELNDQNEPLSGTTRVYSVSGIPTSNDYGEITLISPDTFGTGISTLSFDDLNRALGTFAVGLYMKSESSILYSFTIGYRYLDALTGNYQTFSEEFRAPKDNKWVLGTKTFQALQDSSNIELVITIKYIGGSQDQNDYKFLFHALSVGQWSEEFLSQSIGIEKQNVPESILGAGVYGVSAQAYGISESDGWYLVDKNTLCAKNTSIPMVYGASNTTVLSPNSDGLPSVVLPSQNFLSESGKNQDMTFEAWLRISSAASAPKRIFGNLRGSDGLYVDGAFLVFKYGKYIMSYQVSEWGKPMLIQISLTKNLMTMIVDGQQVTSTSIDVATISFPPSSSVVDGITLNNYWLGFWAYEDVQPVELDSIAIYPYRIPELVAKRRFAYGQAVEVPENINTAYSGTSVMADFAFAQYANSFMYPDLGKWETSTSDNVITKDKTLAAPTYSLPSFTFKTGTYDQWIAQNEAAQNEPNKFFSLKPGSWNSDSYAFIENLFLGNQSAAAIYGLFKIKNTQPQKLFVIEDSLTKNNLSIAFDGEDIVYTLNYGSTSTVVTKILGIGSIAIGEIIPVGINLTNFANYYGGNVAKFIGNRSNLSLYIGGYKTLTETFNGNIYAIGLCSPKNYSGISDLFSTTGVFKQFENVFNVPLTGTYDAGDSYFGDGGGYYDTDGNFVDLGREFWDYYLDGGSPTSFGYVSLIGHVATNTVIATEYIGEYMLDSMTNSYWQDYIPLKTFAKYVDVSASKKEYALDFIQMNIGYPSPTKYSVSDTPSTWTYSQLQFEFSNPVKRTYEELSNPLFTGYESYQELAQKSAKEYYYDTSNSVVKTYVSFQYANTAYGPTLADDAFTTVVPASKDGVIVAGTDWMTTLYEVVDNMVIYPPRDIDIDSVALVTHVRITSKSSQANPVKIRHIKYASQALNYKSSTPIGTRFGSQIFPYSKLGSYYDYKVRNPFTTYRETSPYLYLTRNSGIQMKGSFNPKISRGISVPINRYKSNQFKVLALQAAVRFDEDFFSYYPVEVFEIEANSQHIKVYMQATDPYGKRARIYAINAKTGETTGNVVFYINGKLVKDAIITVKQWAMLGMSFPSLIDFSLGSGSFRICGPLTTNIISYYQSTNMQDVLYIQKRPWIEIKRVDQQDIFWSFWTPAYLWENVLVISTQSYYGVDPGKIYETYTGTNKILVDDGIVAGIGKYGYTVYKGVTWTSETLPAL